ncbi:MAG: molybdopterin-dependent oxidoreductase [Chloroflexi bacterium]|nr:molybdopterin-dependent oxidoreductase [Chloroflexota bacterium]
MRTDRRTFIKAGGATVATGLVLSGLDLGNRLLRAAPGATASTEDRMVPGVCQQCPGGCGIMVRVVNGRGVKIEGNPRYPSNRGTLCPKGAAGLQILYDPDRIHGPLKRAGERGAGRWQPISWEEAINTVAGRLGELRSQGLAHTVAFMSGRNRGQMGGLIGRFCEAFGTSNDIGHSSICEDGSPMGHWMAQGWKAYAAYDWDNCDYLICFGAGFVEAWRPTARLLRAYGDMRRGRLGTRSKIVQVETRFSISAARADEWVPINPATDGAFALALAHVIVRDNLYDRRFVGDHTFGFEDWADKNGHRHLGFKSLVLRDYAPQRVEGITGIPAADIERIAREFASKKPHCIAAGARGSSMQTNGPENRHAIHALNALVGSIDARGGVLRQIDPPFAALPAVVKDDAAASSLRKGRVDYAGTARFPLAGKVYQDVAERVIAGDPYPVKALITYYTNPLFSSTDIDPWKKAIARIPFVVTFSPYMDETTAHADIVLPDCSYLERWHDDVIYPSMGYPVWGIRQPVVKPLYDSRSSADVVIEIAQRLGGSVAQSFPWKDFLELIRFRAQGVFKTAKGSIVAPTFEEWWDRFVKEGVWTDPSYPYATENPDQWKRILATPSGKFEFYSQLLEEKMEHLAEDEAKARRIDVEQALEEILNNLKIKAKGDEFFLPHYEAPRFVGDPKEFPLHLNTYKLMPHAEGRGANVPMLQGMLGLQLGEKWNTWVEINPHTAEKLGLRDKDLAYVESQVGRVKVQVRIHPGAMPQVVNIPFEHGHETYGRWASKLGANPNHIIANEKSNLGGLAAYFATRVKVYKA